MQHKLKMEGNIVPCARKDSQENGHGPSEIIWEFTQQVLRSGSLSVSFSVGPGIRFLEVQQQKRKVTRSPQSRNEDLYIHEM
jgi:hypothetical protein